MHAGACFLRKPCRDSKTWDLLQFTLFSIKRQALSSCRGVGNTQGRACLCQAYTARRNWLG